MTKRRIIITLVCLVVLTLIAGVAVLRKFPLKAGGTVPASPGPKVAIAPKPSPLNSLQAAPEVFTVSYDVSEPVPIYKPDPPYTAEARAAKRQGTVLLSAVVGADGSVADVKVLRPLDPGLDQNAVNTIKTWTLKPALKAGKPVACRVMVEVSYRIF